MAGVVTMYILCRQVCRATWLVWLQCMFSADRCAVLHGWCGYNVCLVPTGVPCYMAGVVTMYVWCRQVCRATCQVWLRCMFGADRCALLHVRCGYDVCLVPTGVPCYMSGVVTMYVWCRQVCRATCLPTVRLSVFRSLTICRSQSL